MYVSYTLENDKNYMVGDYIGFYCFHCFQPIIIKYKLRANINIESNNIEINHLIRPQFYIKCPNCNKHITWNEYLDPNITKSIALLNKKGYVTRCCCEGHYYENSPDTYIQFKYRYNFTPHLNPKYYNLENSFYLDKYNNKHKCSYIRCDNENISIENRMKYLYEWALKLKEYKR